MPELGDKQCALPFTSKIFLWIDKTRNENELHVENCRCQYWHLKLVVKYDLASLVTLGEIGVTLAKFLLHSLHSVSNGDNNLLLPDTIAMKIKWISSVQFSHSVLSDYLQPHELQHSRPPCLSPSPGVHPNSLMSIESVMLSSHLILCCPLLLVPPIPPSISLFQWVNSSHEVAKVLEFQL